MGHGVLADLGVPAAYAMSRFHMHRSAMVVLMARLVPRVSLLVPWYFIFANLRMVGDFSGLILSHMFVALPLIVYIMMSFFDSMSMELEGRRKWTGSPPRDSKDTCRCQWPVSPPPPSSPSSSPGTTSCSRWCWPGQHQDASGGHLQLRVVREHRLGRSHGGGSGGHHTDHGDRPVHTEIHRLRPHRRRTKG